MPSRFVIVKCNECENEQAVFSHSTKRINCAKCGAVLAEPRGGKALILGKVVKVLG